MKNLLWSYNKKIYLTITLIVCVLFIVGVVFEVIEKESELSNMIHDKKVINGLKISGRISLTKNEKGFTIFQISSSDKKIVFPPTSNKEYPLEDLCYILSKGDSIFKNNFSDTLKVYKDNKESPLIFILGKHL